MRNLTHVGVQAAIASAVLFGAGTPFAKALLGDVRPWLLAGLLYTGSGVGLMAWRLVRRAPRVRIQRREVAPLLGALFFAYFSVAPFFGALIAVVMGEPVTWPLAVSAALMALGVWLHLTERHEHTHEAITHSHEHYPDAHHRHAHWRGSEPREERTVEPRRFELLTSCLQSRRSTN